MLVQIASKIRSGDYSWRQVAPKTGGWQPIWFLRRAFYRSASGRYGGVRTARARWCAQADSDDRGRRCESGSTRPHVDRFNTQGAFGDDETVRARTEVVQFNAVAIAAGRCLARRWPENVVGPCGEAVPDHGPGRSRATVRLQTKIAHAGVPPGSRPLRLGTGLMPVESHGMEVYCRSAGVACEELRGA